MNILNICTMDNGGSGNAARRIHLGLKSISVKSKMLVLHRTSSDKDIMQVNLRSDAGLYKRKPRINRFFSSLPSLSKHKQHTLFSDDRVRHDISNHPLVREADIINLHWVKGMVDHTRFFKTVVNKPIVWTLHDKNPFTGGCHCSGSCRKYYKGCGACPQLDSNNPNDLSRQIFKRKESAYKNKNIHIVSPSNELKNCAKKSLLFKNFPIDVIPHGVPIDIFKKYNKKAARDILKLPHDKTLIMFGVHYNTDKKGFIYLRQALHILRNKLDPSNIALVLFGIDSSINMPYKKTNLHVYRLGYIIFEDLLSIIYSSADIFVAPSIEEAFGLTCLESMSCGTPVIGFNIGGFRDMIISHKTGLFAKYKNASDLADKIKYLIKHPKNRIAFGKNARKRVQKEYTLELQAKRYLKLYKRLLRS